MRHPRTRTISIPVVAKVCTLNHRMHWRAQAPHKKAWRTAAAQMAATLGTPTQRRLHGRWYLWISYPVTSPSIRRDPDNWVLTSKWIIDGLVDAGVLEDDDSDHLVTLNATFHRAADNPNVIVCLTDTLEGAA
jgi:crossover junction endodeoxyribonuclease RusA